MTAIPSLRQRVNVTPWDVLLDEVQRAAFRADWVDRICESITTEMNELEQKIHDEPDDAKFAEVQYRSLRSELKEWLKESRDERKHLVQVSNDCIKHDINKYLILRTEINGRLIAKVLGDALDSAQLDQASRSKVVRGLRGALEQVSGDAGSGQTRGLEAVADVFGKVNVQVVEDGYSLGQV